MSNTATWADPDTTRDQSVPGHNPAGVYILDPSTTLAKENRDNIVVITSAAQTGTTSSTDQTNASGKGVNVYIATGGFGAGASAITATIECKDPVSGHYYTILQSASLTANAFAILQVYPGLTAATNLIANNVLPRTWRVTLTASNWGTGGSIVGVSAAIMCH